MWFSDEKLAATSAAGRGSVPEAANDGTSDRSIFELEGAGAQGVVVWDVAAQEMPYAISYRGDAQILPQTAPEINAAIDKFFQRFRKSGLKVGVCAPLPSESCFMAGAHVPAEGPRPGTDRSAIEGRRQMSFLLRNCANAKSDGEFTKNCENIIDSARALGDHTAGFGGHLNRYAQLIVG